MTDRTGLIEICQMFGLTRSELLIELAAGRLAATGRPSKDGTCWTDIGVEAGELARWAKATGRRPS